MKMEKTKSTKLILESGLPWILILNIARSRKKLKIKDTLEKYILNIAAQTCNEVSGIAGALLLFIVLMVIFDIEGKVIVAGASLLLVAFLIISNGIKANLTVSETIKLLYLHIRILLITRR